MSQSAPAPAPTRAGPTASSPVGSAAGGLRGDPARRKALALTIIDWVMPVATVVLMVVFAVQSSVFLTPGNLLAVATQNAPTFIVAAIAAMLLMAGYADLSVGSIMALAGVAAGLSFNAFGVVPGVLIGLLVGVLMGAVNGVLVGTLGFSPIVVTLGLLAAGRGMAQYLAPGSVFGFPQAVADFGSGSVAGVPNLVIVAAVASTAAIIVMTRLPLGRQIISIGVNPRAAFLVGVRVKPVITWLYIAVGFAAAVAGILQVARLNSAPSGTLGSGFEVTVLTAILLGGIPFNGGKGSIWRVLVGVWLIGVLKNGITLLNIGTEMSLMITGAVLVVAAALEALRYFIRR